MNSGLCTRCEQPFDDHRLPAVLPLGTILPTAELPLCPPKKV